MELSKLQAREVKNAIRSGLGVSHFCTKYSCTKEELGDRIGQIYKRNERDAKKIFGSLEENDRKASKKRPAVKNPKDNPSVPTEEIVANSVTEVEAEAPTEAIEEPVFEIAKANIEELRELERSLSNDIVRLESAHKALIREHHAYGDELANLKKLVDDIKAKLKEFQKEYENIKKKDEALIKESPAICKERNEKAIILENVRTRIAELSKITIFVCNDGTIMTEDEKVEVLLDESGSDELHKELVDNADCEHLRVKEIRVLARIIKVCEHLSKENLEVVFDNPEIEEVFIKMRVN